MKTTTTILSVLLLSAVSITSANANWFSNQKTNTMFNLGSVRNPTPAELRAYRHENFLAAQAREAKARNSGEGTVQRPSQM